MELCPRCDTQVDTYTNAGFQRFVMHGDCPGGFAYVPLAKGDLESRYTPPSEWCPATYRWHSKDWDSTEIEVSELVAAFVRALQPEIVVETGTAFGQTAIEIGYALQRNDHGILHTIEASPERAKLASEAIDEAMLADWVHVHETTSLAFDPPAGIGFAWLDSLLDLRVPEFRHLYPHLLPGAIVGFHDTAPHQGTLWEQIETLEAEGLCLPIRLRTPRGVVFAEVTKPKEGS